MKPRALPLQLFRTGAKRGRKLSYNSVTVICHKWKKPNADRRAEKVAEWRQKKVGGRERQKGRERELACVSETDVTAKNNQYNLRWWKRPFGLGLSLWLTLSLAYTWCKSPLLCAAQISISGEGVPKKPPLNWRMHFTREVAAVFPRGKAAKSRPKMLISLLTLCQNSCKGSAAAFSSLCDRAGAWRRVLAARS